MKYTQGINTVRALSHLPAKTFFGILVIKCTGRPSKELEVHLRKICKFVKREK